MANHGLAEFLGQLAGEGQLVRVAAEVDGELEIVEITRRVAQDAGPALLFEHVRGQTLGVATNVLGTVERVCRALGIDSLEEIAARIDAAVREHTPQSWLDRLKLGSGEAGIDKLRPRLVKSGVCQQVVHLGRDVNLATFPLLRSWPGESGPGLLGGLLLAEIADGQTCLTPVTLMQLDANRLAVVGPAGDVIARLWQRSRELGTQTPLAVVLGGDPALAIAAHLELPEYVSAGHVAGLIRGRALEFVKCRTHGLAVPADAELIVEGFLDPQADETTVTASLAGPYLRQAAAPVLHVSAITHRTRAVVPAVIAGGRSGEAVVLAKVWERVLLPSVQRLAPDVTDIGVPMLEGVQAFAFVALRKRFAHQARQVAAALWGTAALRRARYLVIVDAEVNVHDLAAVWGRVATTVAPERDVLTWDGPADPGDFVGSQLPLARRVAIDATTKTGEERAEGQPVCQEAGEEILRQVTSRWAEYQIPLSGVERAQ